MTRQMTIEAKFLMPSSETLPPNQPPSPVYVSPGGRIFGEQVAGLCDKALWVSPFVPFALGGGAWTGWFPIGKDGPYLTLSYPVSLHVWHPVAFVRDGDEQRVYLDGDLLASQQLAGTPYDLPIANSSGSQMTIGGFLYKSTSVTPDNLDPAFHGAIQWVRVSNAARYSGSFALPPSTVPSPDPSTLVLFDFSNVQPVT